MSSSGPHHAFSSIADSLNRLPDSSTIATPFGYADISEKPQPHAWGFLDVIPALPGEGGKVLALLPSRRLL